MHPYASRRAHPVDPPNGYRTATRAYLHHDQGAIRQCLEPLSTFAGSCPTRPVGVSVWLDIDAAGTVDRIVPFTATEDPYDRPPSPEVAACIGKVTAQWTYPPFEDGWTTLGLILEPDGEPR